MQLAHRATENAEEPSLAEGMSGQLRVTCGPMCGLGTKIRGSVTNVIIVIVIIIISVNIKLVLLLLLLFVLVCPVGVYSIILSDLIL